jgi:hypothetical protein
VTKRSFCTAFFTFVAVIVLTTAFSLGGWARQVDGLKPAPTADFGNIPLYFIPNRGQVDDTALFYAKTPRYTLWLTRQGMVFDSFPSTDSNQREVSRLVFLGANKDIRAAAENATAHRVNFFKGNNRSKWLKGIPTSAAVRYKNVYRNIDLKVYGVSKQIEYDWLVKPGADPADIGFAYRGIKHSAVDEDGNLVVKTANGEWLHQKPRAFQVLDGQKVEVAAAFTIRNETDDQYGFRVGPYDKDHELVIDPLILVQSGFLGSSGDDAVCAIAVDSGGYLYAAGYAGGPNFPTASAYQPGHGGNWDCFITKFTQDGSGLVFSTYLGGGNHDYAFEMVLGPGGLIYIAGTTHSSDFPTVNPYQAALNGVGDVCAAILSSDGSSLVYSTFLGGSDSDYCYALGVTPAGEICLGGHTVSNDFPVYNAYDSTFGYPTSNDYSDVFLTKFNATGDALVFSTYLGGADNDYCGSLAIASNGDIYIAGNTENSNFPTSQWAYQRSFGGVADGYIARFTSTGALDASTLYGGSAYDSISEIALDANGYLYAAGQSGSATNFNTHRTFVLKFYDIDTTGSHLVYSTSLGDPGVYSTGPAIAVGPGGKAYITGTTTSPGFPVVSAFQDTHAGGEDAFMLVLSADGSTVDRSTFIGGAANDGGYDIFIDASGMIYVGGYTFSPSFPTYQGFQATHSGLRDGFVCKIEDSPYTITVTSPNGGETWGPGKVHDITWTTSGGFVDEVLLHYSTDNGSTWNLIVGPITNYGIHSWTVPDLDSDQCLVRVQHASSAARDVSDAVFTIATPVLALTAPNGGENWGVFETHDITWDPSGLGGNVLLYYSIDNGGNWQLIAGPIPDNGTYSWTIPQTPSSECLVKVEHETGAISDQSDAVFTIEAPTVTVIAPNGGESWGIGETHNITWTTTGVTTEVQLQYSYDNGSTWNLIAGPVPDNGTYAWTIPQTPSEECMVKVELYDFPANDVSDAVFTIAAPTVTVTAPNGGESWGRGAASIFLQQR